MSVAASSNGHRDLPFGPPDGARADLHEIRNYVDFGTGADRNDLDRTPSLASPRLIVGKKGVGKTVYLRNLRANAHDEGSVYADDVRHEGPATEDVIRVCEMYPPHLAAQSWKWIWRRAIMRSLASHILCQPDLRHELNEQQTKLLEGEFRPLVGRFRYPASVYEEAESIASHARDASSLREELRHKDWREIEALLAHVLPKLPPMCFYLDSLDEYFSSAPTYWLRCQLGLCQAVLELLRDQRFGSRLHVVVAIRDLVRSSLLQGENTTRFVRAKHILVLDWDHPSIRRFLLEKIRRLPDRLRMDPNQDGVSGWLGRNEIHNHRRGVDEELETYLLRHTRLIPRDIVQLGNELSLAVREAKANRQRSVDPETIRAAVAKVSKEFADEQIAVCANHLASDSMPPEAGRQGYAEFYVSRPYSDTVEDELCRFISAVGYDRFTMRALVSALEETNGPVLSAHPDPLNVLWQNGLLGYDPDKDELRYSHFYGAEDVADFRLPDRFHSYVFHPMVGHRVSIDPIGPPVTGFRTRVAWEH